LAGQYSRIKEGDSMILKGMDLFMDLIMKSHYIVALTGAGISTNAGIPDFRGPNGLYNRKDIPSDKIFDFEYFKEDPSLFYTHIHELISLFDKAKPTKGHLLLKKLEDLGKLKTVVTQNIDGLHQKAGNTNVIELHGNFEKFYCINCNNEVLSDNPVYKDILSSVKSRKVPKCEKCGNAMKPNVVFFGEYVRDLEKALTEVQKGDMLICIGTSLTVYPAAMLPGYLHDQSKLVIINQQDTPYDEKAKVVLHEDIDGVVDKLKIL
jgi:NAD-dependent deacetylase